MGGGQADIADEPIARRLIGLTYGDRSPLTLIREDTLDITLTDQAHAS